MNIHRSIYVLLVLALLCAPAFAQERFTATIASGASVSSLVTLPNRCMPTAIVIPGTWTTANLTFQVTLDGGTSYGNRRDEFGSEVAATVTAAGDVIDLPPAQWFWVKTFRIRSGTSGTPVNQGGARTLTVLCSR
jgi:hypothetical protein